MTLGPMRTGRHLGRTLYLDTGEDWSAHQCIGLVDTPEQAQAIVAAVNAAQAGPAMSPELAAAYHKLYDTYWNHSGSVEGPDGYSMLTYAEINALDEAAGAVERLLTPGNAKSPAGHPRDGEWPAGLRRC